MKRGFTLVELLAVIIILGIIALISFPNIINIFLGSSKKLMETQIKQIENVSRTWATQNTGKIGDCYILTLEELKKLGLLQNEDIINPDTNKELDGCVKIVYSTSTNQNDYTYTEAVNCSCPSN